MHLAYLFSRYSVSGAVPLVQEMQKALIGFLTKELGNTKEAGQVFMLLNPANNPNEKIPAEIWIDNALNLGHQRLRELHQQNTGAAIGSFRPLAPKHGLNIQAVDLLAITANPLDAEKIRIPRQFVKRVDTSSDLRPQKLCHASEKSFRNGANLDWFLLEYFSYKNQDFKHHIRRELLKLQSFFKSFSF